MPQPHVMFYHDGRHPLIYMYEPPMQKEEYEAAVDELLGTPVEAIMFFLGCCLELGAGSGACPPAAACRSKQRKKAASRKRDAAVS